MFAGNEWLFVVVDVLVGLSVAGVVIAVRGPTWERRVDERVRGVRPVVRGEPADVTADLLLATASDGRARVRRDGTDVVVIESRYLPVLAVVIAVVAFPVGLLALLWRQTDTAIVVAAPAGGGTTQLRMSGRFSRRSVRDINRVIEARSVPRSAEAELSQ